MLFARTMASLCAVLAMLTGALWVVRRYDLRLPGRVGGVRRGRLSVIERIALDTKRSLLLVRQDGREHLLLLSPEGHVVLDRGRVEQVEAPAHPIAEPANAVSDPDPATDFTFFPWPRIAQPNQGMAAHCAA
jgi:flagellar biogenesis protein FliO